MVVELHGVLTCPVILEGMKIQPSKSVQISFVSRCSNCSDCFSIALHNARSPACREAPVNLKAIQVRVIELDIHHTNLGTEPEIRNIEIT